MSNSAKVTAVCMLVVVLDFIFTRVRVSRSRCSAGFCLPCHSVCRCMFITITRRILLYCDPDVFQWTYSNYNHPKMKGQQVPMIVLAERELVVALELSRDTGRLGV